MSNLGTNPRVPIRKLITARLQGRVLLRCMSVDAVFSNVLDLKSRLDLEWIGVALAEGKLGLFRSHQAF